MDYLPIDEAARWSRLHPNTIRRLLRAGILRGYKASQAGKLRWFVSARSLRDYADPLYGFLLDLPGPKLFLKKREAETGDGA